MHPEMEQKFYEIKVKSFQKIFPNLNFDELIKQPEDDDDCDIDNVWDYYFDKNTKKMYAYDQFERGNKWRECDKKEIDMVGYFNEYF